MFPLFNGMGLSKFQVDICMYDLSLKLLRDEEIDIII